MLHTYERKGAVLTGRHIEFYVTENECIRVSAESFFFSLSAEQLA